VNISTYLNIFVNRAICIDFEKGVV